MKTVTACGKLEKMKSRGFTLIELLITVTIIGILAAIAVTSYVGVTLKAARTEAYSNLQSLKLLEEQFFAENGAYVAGANTAAIQAALPGFKPGTQLSYNYVVTSVNNSCVPTPPTVPYNGAAGPIPNGNANTPCFIATATGIANTRVGPPSRNPGDVFVIDCNNTTNF